jgi:hypothetical protein
LSIKGLEFATSCFGAIALFIYSGFRDAIAYSMDALIPGFYAWFGSLRIRIGGSEAEETYPGTIHSFAGIALVLPGYRIFSTYQGDYDP